jgi:L-ascorbate metabolism protein UlaG (beta-lactamase superfamily)
MKITRLKHAGFIVEADDQRLGVDVGDFTDPKGLAALGKLDALLASHGHSDHYTEANVLAAAAPVAAPFDVVALLPKGIAAHTLHLGQTLVLAGFSITPTFADHGSKLSSPIENYGLVIERNGCRIYYVGDMAMATPPPPGPFSLVFIAVDGTGFVFDAEQAADYIRAMGHRGTVVPIHDGDGDEPEHAMRFADLAAGLCEVVLINVGESVEVKS